MPHICAPDHRSHVQLRSTLRLQSNSVVTKWLCDGSPCQWEAVQTYMHVVHEPGIERRGTVCWLATANGQQVIIKDTWVDKDRQWEEAEFLEECQKNGIVGVSLLIDQEDVQVDGICNSTQIHCDPTISLADAEDWVHCHLVMTLVCLSLEMFSCESKLIQAFIDFVESMYFPYLNMCISDV